MMKVLRISETFISRLMKVYKDKDVFFSYKEKQNKENKLSY